MFFDVDMISEDSESFVNNLNLTVLDFYQNSTINDMNLPPVVLKSQMQRGIILFEEHLQHLKNEDIAFNTNNSNPFYESFPIDIQPSQCIDYSVSIIEKDKFKRQKNNEVARKSRALPKK